jgi:hypothetical protein
MSKSFSTPKFRPIAIGLLVVFVNGCTLAPSMGIRPEPPGGAFSQEVLDGCAKRHPGTDKNVYPQCLDFYSVVHWANQLSEAYRSRATMNEWSIYFAGTLALASLAAVGGIAATGHGASDALAIIPIVGGFTSGFFALLDNKAKAAAYTEAANEIGISLAAAMTNLSDDKPRYRETRATLYEGVVKAINKLETQRSTLAAAAAEKRVETEKLQNEAARARINAAESKELTPAHTETVAGDLVVLTVRKIDLTEFDQKDIKLLVDEKAANIVAVGFDTVTFQAPAATSGDHLVMLQIKGRSIPLPLKLKYK